MKGKTILITGVGGTLGSEFARQLHKNNTIIGIDNNEWAVAELQRDLPDIEIKLNDFDNWRFNQDPVDLVIHCAAYKHVNLGEQNPHTFIENNIQKAGKLFAEAYKHNSDILFISTDKAVEPSGLYGYTKAVGEYLCKHYGGKVARCGNLLNSSGSVIPVWEKAILEGKPIPITDIKMTRYVITVENAVRGIVEGFERGLELIIPDCREVSLMELLDEVLERHNIKSKDATIEIIGMRPGERLREKLRWKEEEDAQGIL